MKRRFRSFRVEPDIDPIYVLYGFSAILPAIAASRFVVNYASPPWPAFAAVVFGGIGITLTACIRSWWLDQLPTPLYGLKCLRCGYNLKFNKGRCPECGAPSIASTGRFAEVIPA